MICQPIRSVLRQQVDLFGDIFQLFSLMAVHKQVHVIFCLIQCLQQHDEAHFSPAGFQIVDGDEDVVFHKFLERTVVFQQETYKSSECSLVRKSRMPIVVMPCSLR